MIVEEYVNQAARRFDEAGLHFGHGTETAWDEAVWLVKHVLALPASAELLADQRLVPDQQHQADRLVEQRIQSRKPLAYLINSAWFCGLEFYVDERVIIPRSPIAELICREFVPWLSAPPKRILDLGSGSGCIAIALAMQFGRATVDATDISAQALAVARVNVERYKLTDRVTLIAADIFDGLPNRRYDLIVSNPPYVDAEDMANLPNEYRHEPALALESGLDGLDLVRRILRQATDYLSKQGVLICEVGNSQMALEQTYPEVPFMWLEFANGGQGVFLITAEELTRYAHVF